ncbi:actin-binding LIM protein 2 isoform X6 [Pantherophis guttatus]|uniref:Actin-binding LIM protein 2 isoform X6 n=1 Tax=Pantherophis guttatus TaxID=94885 RepID=A0ABM3Z9D5_PANGU|nr:actin-binding LIM protein 2 isoform X6 [Pantherophis guttatus]
MDQSRSLRTGEERWRSWLLGTLDHPWPPEEASSHVPLDLLQASQRQAVHSHLETPSGAAILCHNCGSPCKGEVLRVQKKYFHIKCFVCKACGCDLAQGGFFVRQGDYVCTSDYQRLYGTRCFSCDEFIEGEVVSALGKTYHPNCFVCVLCRQPFPPGDRVTFNGKECVCQKCSLPPAGASFPVLRNCGNCGSEIKNGQSLVALDKHWHLTCFKCKICGKLLTGEYISKDGVPYCERDYHTTFGIQCDRCGKFITGRVLEAGEKHYHPTCACCDKCNQMFAEGEEMYLQGSSIWHPACRQAAKVEEKAKLQETRTSSESIISVPPSSTSCSPSRIIYAKLGEEILDYRDLAALPKNKAIYNIDRPDMISYSPYISHSTNDRPSYTEGDQEDQPLKPCRISSPSSTSSLGYGRTTPLCASPPNFSRAGSRKSDGEGSSDQESKKLKSSWLTLKGDVDFRTNSPDLDTQSLPQSPGTDRQLQRLQSNTNCTYLRFPYSKSASLPDYGKQGLQHAAGVGPDDQEAAWGKREYKVRKAIKDIKAC